MTRIVTACSGILQPPSSVADRWISRATAATVAGLAVVAGAISYSHLRRLAQDHGQFGWHAHAFPLSVDGIEIVASLVPLADRRAGRRSGWLPWAALTIGTVGSLAANVATAGPDTVSRVIAGWPAVALLIAVKLLSGILEAPGTVSGPSAAHIAAEPVRQVSADEQIALRPGRTDSTVGYRTRARSGRTISTARSTVRSGQRSPAPAPQPGFLLAAARTIRDDLVGDGRPVTRDSVAARLRQAGHRIGNARMTALLRVLHNDAATATGADVLAAYPGR